MTNNIFLFQDMHLFTVLPIILMLSLFCTVSTAFCIHPIFKDPMSVTVYITDMNITTNMQIYELSVDPPVHYALLKIASKKLFGYINLSQINHDTWETAGGLKIVVINHIDKSTGDLNSLINIMTTKDVIIHQMWLNCKLEEYEQSIKRPVYFWNWLPIITLILIGWILLWFIIGTIINLFTLSHVQLYYKDQRYMWRCVNQSLTIFTVFNYFVKENKELNKQLQKLMVEVHKGCDVIIVNPKASDYDYETLDDYIELEDINNSDDKDDIVDRQYENLPVREQSKGS